MSNQRRNQRRTDQRGSGFQSLYGLNQPSFHDSPCPSYYNNHYGFTETQLRPFNSGHGTVGDGYGKGVNAGQAHYSLNMSGAGSQQSSEWSETSTDWSDFTNSDQWSETSDDLSREGEAACACGGDCDCDCGCAETGVCMCGDSCPCNCGCASEASEQSGGSHTGDHALPWRWFNPSSPLGSNASNANNPLVTKVGPSGNSPSFDSTNMIGGRRRNQRKHDDDFVDEELRRRKRRNQRKHDDDFVDEEL